MNKPCDIYGDPAGMTNEERERAERQREAAIEALEDPLWGAVGEAADTLVDDMADDPLDAA